MGMSLELAESWREGLFIAKLILWAMYSKNRGLGEACNAKGDLRGSFQSLIGPPWQEPPQAGVGCPAGHLEPSNFLRWKRL